MIDRSTQALLRLLRHRDPEIRQQGRELARSLPPPLPPEVAFHFQLVALIVWMEQLRDRTEQAPPLLRFSPAQLHRLPQRLRLHCDRNWWQVGNHAHDRDESRLILHLFGASAALPRRPTRSLTLVTRGGVYRQVVEDLL